MKLIYECERCHRQFGDEHKCMVHELSHYSDEEAIKYYITKVVNKEICHYCDNVYFLYGCEANCRFKTCCSANNYKDFKVKDGAFNDFKR